MRSVRRHVVMRRAAASARQGSVMPRRSGEGCGGRDNDRWRARLRQPLRNPPRQTSLGAKRKGEQPDRAGCLTGARRLRSGQQGLERASLAMEPFLGGMRRVIRDRHRGARAEHRSGKSRRARQRRGGGESRAENRHRIGDSQPGPQKGAPQSREQGGTGQHAPTRPALRRRRQAAKGHRGDVPRMHILLEKNILQSVVSLKERLG